MADVTGDQGGGGGQKRHGCLTALLIVFGILTAVGAIANFVTKDWLAKYLPGAPDWAEAGVVAMGVLGLLAVASLVAIWRWKVWGVYAYVAIAIIVFVLNLMIGLGLMKSLWGVVGPFLVIVFVSRQWDDFE